MKNTKTVQNALILLLLALLAAAAPAVTSVITRHNTGADFLKSDTENIVIDSNGTLRLARKTVPIDTGDLLKNVWAVNCLLADTRGTLFLGTSPDGKVFRVVSDKAVQVYPAQSDEAAANQGDGISNQHVFALGLDVADRLLIGLSGQNGKLVRLNPDPETIFEHEKVQYIFAIARDADNNIYLGTGPEGLIFRLNPFGQNPEIFYDAQDKNILSLAFGDGVLYAGSDQRGLIYKITLADKKASVLYDAAPTEITALMTDPQGNVFAAATSAQVAAEQLKAASQALAKLPGRPDGTSPSPTATLNTPNSDPAKKEEQASKPAPPLPPPPPAARVTGQIYKITPEGFVTTVFSEMAVFYALAPGEGTLWLGSGNKGRLYTVDLATEEKSIAYEDKLSAQITALARVNGDLYLGLSNPARLLRLEKGYAPRGVFQSPLIDATQPASWGKLQLEADLPDACQIQMASRSGNVDDPNDSTFSPWSDEMLLTGPVDLASPVGRFLRYRLTLQTSDPEKTPVVREVAVSHVIPNLAPVVNAVGVARSRDKLKPTFLEVVFSAQDENRDDLTATIDFRRLGRTRWTLLKEDLAVPKFEFDSRTLEDGRYEIRVTVDDAKSNNAATTLTGSRISDPFFIDNTPPSIDAADININGSTVVLKLKITDAISVIGKVAHTVNSNEKWTNVLSDDKVYDTPTETVTISISDLKSGANIIAVSVADDLGNTLYKTFEAEIP